MTRAKRVAVIGGGLSGLAAAKAFKAQGHAVVGFEQARHLGGVWDPDRSYPGVHTQTSKSLYRFTDLPHPADHPEWPSGAQMHGYLMSYAHKHGLASLYRMQARVLSMQSGEHGGWTLTIEHGAVQEMQAFDFVVVASGTFSKAHRVVHAGQDMFGGRILHSSEFVDPSVVQGKTVAVIGGSKSATDICVNALKHGALKAHMIYRRDVWRVPYKIAGLVNFKHLFFSRFQEVQYRDWQPRGLGSMLMKLLWPLSKLSFKLVETTLKLQLGLKRHDMVPTTPIEPGLNCSAPIVTPGFFEGLHAGSIVAHRSEVARYGGSTLHLANGQAVQADVVVQATGWQQGYDFLPAQAQACLRDANDGFMLYRFAVHPEIPNLGFVGANGSFYTTLTSELVAHWLVRYADGRLERLPTASQMHEEIVRIAHWRQTERPAAAEGGGLCVAPFHHRHFDDLLADMGVRRSLLDWLAELFSYPRASRLGRLLASAPDYRAEGAQVLAGR